MTKCKYCKLYLPKQDSFCKCQDEWDFRELTINEMERDITYERI